MWVYKTLHTYTSSQKFVQQSLPEKEKCAPSPKELKCNDHNPSMWKHAPIDAHIQIQNHLFIYIYINK